VRKSLPLALAAVVAAAAALTGCVPASGGPATSGPTTTARVTMDTPTTLDPQRSIALPDYQLARLAFDTLVRKDDTGLVPGIAASWESTPTSTVFTLRDDATCSDGTAITPSIVAASLEAFVRDGDPGGVAEAFGGSIPTITPDDGAGTVTVEVEMPWGELAQAMSVASTGIVCPAGLDAKDDLGSSAVEGAGSGPYVLESFEPGVKYTFALRDDYTAWPEWTTELPGEAPQTIEYIVAPDPSATANMTLSGDLDLARIMPDSRSRFDGSSDVTLTEFPFGTFYVLFNEREASPFADAALRTAVAQVLDRDQFFQTTTDGTGELLTSLASTATPCVSDAANPAIIPLDPDAASSVLAGVKIRLLGAQVVGTQGSGNELLQEELRAAGADVTMENVDVGTWASKAFGQPDTWDLTIYPDLNFLGSLASPLSKFTGPDILEGGGNVGGTTNAEAADLFDQARAAADEDQRCELYNGATDALIANADTIPLVNEAYIYAARDGFAVYMLGGSLDDYIFRIVG
jgi:peptide/nickel transport system substrate-binding protein